MSEGSDRALARRGRIAARPTLPTGSDAVLASGIHALEIATARDTLLYVPPGYRAEDPAPLAVVLHGAGGDARRGLDVLLPWAEGRNLLLLAPASRGTTWDLLRGGYGDDIALLDRALAATFARCGVDPARLAIGGFSDGASYALSVGLTNGDLFGHILAFAPGFVAPGALTGTPRIFVAHGTRDQILPIDRCSRRIVPQLRRAGCDLRYREFDGPHTIPPEIGRAGLDWFLDTPEPA